MRATFLSCIALLPTDHMRVVPRRGAWNLYVAEVGNDRPQIPASVKQEPDVPTCRSCLGCDGVLFQSLNAQPISELIQSFAQFDAKRNAVYQPLAVEHFRALSG